MQRGGGWGDLEGTPHGTVEGQGGVCKAKKKKPQQRRIAYLDRSNFNQS